MALESTNPAEIAVVIVNYRTPELTKRCIAALQSERARLPRLRAVIVDGGSCDGSAEELARELEDPKLQDWATLVPLPLNGGFGWANNQAILRIASNGSPPDFIYLLNPDTEVRLGAIASLVSDLHAHPRCAAAGSLLLDAAGKPAASAFRFPSPASDFIKGAESERLERLLRIEPIAVSSDHSCDVDWVTGASMMLRTDALRGSGLFDDGFFLYFEEVELAYRLRKNGWTVRHVPESRVMHLEGAATGMANGGERVPPRYWYEARRRYYAVTAGRMQAYIANLAFLGGRSLLLVKWLAARKIRPDRPRVHALLRWGFWVRRHDLTPAITVLGDAIGRPPRWMDAE